MYTNENAGGNSAKTSAAATPFTIYCDNEPESDPSPIKMTSAKKDSPPRVSLPRPKFGKPLSVHKDVPAAHHTPVDKENMPGEKFFYLSGFQTLGIIITEPFESWTSNSL